MSCEHRASWLTVGHLTIKCENCDRIWVSDLPDRLMKCNQCGDVTLARPGLVVYHDSCKAPVLGVYEPYRPNSKAQP